MAGDEKQKEHAEKRNSSKDWILWTLAAIFIVGSIAVMFYVDYQAPGSSGAKALPADAPDN